MTTEASTVTITFEDLPSGTALGSQYSGVAFGNAVILSSGIALNEFEFPPHSGSNTASDVGGPMTITFTSPLQIFGGRFTYSVPVTIQAYDSSGNLLASATSRFSNNEALSGVAGSQPNELLTLSSPAGIAKLVLTGSGGGTSFTLDDMTVSTVSRCDLNQDGVTNVTDVQRIVNEVGATPATDDLNGDSRIDSLDIQLVVTSALGSVCAAK